MAAAAIKNRYSRHFVARRPWRRRSMTAIMRRIDEPMTIRQSRPESLVVSHVQGLPHDGIIVVRRRKEIRNAAEITSAFLHDWLAATRSGALGFASAGAF